MQTDEGLAPGAGQVVDLEHLHGGVAAFEGRLSKRRLALDAERDFHGALHAGRGEVEFLYAGAVLVAHIVDVLRELVFELL